MGHNLSNEDKDMKCVICKFGETREGTSTVTFERHGVTVVIKAVPAQVCVNCGEQYVDASIAKSLLEQAELAASRGVHLEVREYATV